jgi:benzoyl-CoA reductase/2-hydroxyglutaryl-CoA dehydratase subunit BcrC/BadD/HgdB
LTAIASVPGRIDTIRSHKARGGAVAAVFPIHTPRALFRAFDILPVEVWGPPGADASRGAEHLQPYVCSIVQNALGYLLAGGLDIVDVLVVPHACDSLQGLGSILIDFVSPTQPVIPIYLPRGRRASDVAFLADECRAIYGRLEALTGRSPSDADLMACIHREETADDLLARLHEGRGRLGLSDLDFYRVVRSREYLPAEAFIALAGQALAHVGGTPQEDIPILLSGIVPEPMGLLSAIAEMGGRVAADDLAACGRRLYPTGEGEGPFRRMAGRIVKGPPDTMRGSPIGERLAHLLRLAETSGARGAIFYTIKFCEPELFYLPALRKGLQDAGLPSVVVEVDINDPLSHQVLTRIEAFMEMLR